MKYVHNPVSTPMVTVRPFPLEVPYCYVLPQATTRKARTIMADSALTWIASSLPDRPLSRRRLAATPSGCRLLSGPARADPVSITNGEQTLGSASSAQPIELEPTDTRATMAHCSGGPEALAAQDRGHSAGLRGSALSRHSATLHRRSEGSLLPKLPQEDPDGEPKHLDVLLATICCGLI